MNGEGTRAGACSFETVLNDDELKLDGSSSPIKLDPGLVMVNGFICPDMPEEVSSVARFDNWMWKMALE